MIAEKAFGQLLQLDERWEVTAAVFETEPREQFVIAVRETGKLWPSLRCPEGRCGEIKVVCHDHAEPRRWRHLDAFGKRTEIVCAPPRARCKGCEKIWTVKVPWEGKGKHFTKDFEAFSLTLMKEMPVKRAEEILGENDTRLWRMLRAHVEAAYEDLDMSNVTQVGLDEMSVHKGHKYLTVFADLVAHRVLFATEGKDHWTLHDFVAALEAHNGHPHGITKMAIDLSPAYRKGIEERMRNAIIVYDPFHVSALVGKAVDEVRRRECGAGNDAIKEALKGSLHLFRKNPENLTDRQKDELDRLDLAGMATGQAYQVRLGLRAIYQGRKDKQWADYRLGAWINWARAKCERWGHWLQPVARAVNTIEKHREGILAHWDGELSTAYLEGLNSVFSAVKRKARGYRNTDYLKTILYFIAGKLPLNLYPSPGK